MLCRRGRVTRDVHPAIGSLARSRIGLLKRLLLSLSQTMEFCQKQLCSLEFLLPVSKCIYLAL